MVLEDFAPCHFAGFEEGVGEGQAEEREVEAYGEEGEAEGGDDVGC